MVDAVQENVHEFTGAKLPDSRRIVHHSRPAFDKDHHGGAAVWRLGQGIGEVLGHSLSRTIRRMIGPQETSLTAQLGLVALAGTPGADKVTDR